MKRDCLEVKCNNCEEFGHLHRQCERPKCRRCGELDHFAQDCTNKQTCGTCQGPHATVHCHVNKQEPDKKKKKKKHNVSSAGGFIPVAKNYNRLVTKELSPEKQDIVDLIQRQQAPSINAFRNQAFDIQQHQHDQFNGGDNGGSSWNSGEDGGNASVGNGGGDWWGTDQPAFDGW